MVGMGMASKTLQGAFDPLERLLKERQQVDEQNFQNSIKNNDRAIAAKLQGIDSLGGLNQAEDAGLSLAALNERLGATYSQDALAAGLKDRRGQLRDEAYGAGLLAANQAADSELSLLAGNKAMEQQLLQAGMAPEAIPGFVSKYQEQNAFRNAQYTDTKTKNTDMLLGRFGTPKNNQEAQAFLDQADGMGVPYDRDRFLETLTRELAGSREDLQDTQAQEDRVRRLVREDTAQQREDVRWQQTQDRYANEMRVMDRQWDLLQQNLTPEQALEVENNRLQAQEFVDTVQSHVTNTAAGLDTQIAATRGFDEERYTHLKKQISEGKDAFDLLDQQVASTWLSFDKIGGRKGGAAKSLLQEKVRELSSLPNISDVDATIMVHQAATAAVRDNLLDSGKGIDINIFDQQLQSVFKNWTTAYTLQNRKQEVLKEGENALRQLTSQVAQQVNQWKIQQMGANKTNTPATLKAFDTKLSADSALFPQAAAASPQETVKQPLPVIATPNGFKVQTAEGILRKATQAETDQYLKRQQETVNKDVINLVRPMTW
jgi:hypothetical protein